MKSGWMRIAGGWLVLGLLVGVIGGSSTPLFGKSYKIMAVGDSLTSGSVPGGYRLPEYTLLVNAGHTVDFVGHMHTNPSPLLPDNDHEGHPGAIISGATDTYQNEIAYWMDKENWLGAYQPDYIQLMIGTNDIDRRMVAGASARLDALVNYITTHRPSAQLLVASIPPIFGKGLEGDVNAFNAAIPGIVSKYVKLGRNVKFVDVYSALTLDDFKDGDGIHPLQSGYDKIAAAFAGAITGSPKPVTPKPTSPKPTPPKSATLGLLVFGAAGLLCRRLLPGRPGRPKKEKEREK